MALSKHKHRLWERILVLSWFVLLWGLAASLYHGTATELLSGPFVLVSIGVLAGAATLTSWASMGGRATTSGQDLARMLGTRIGGFLVAAFCNGLGLYLVLHSSVRELYVLTCSPADATVVVEGRPTLAKCGRANFLSADNVLAVYAPGYAPDAPRAVMDRDRDADYRIELELQPLQPWSCQATESTDHDDAEDLAPRCPTPATDAPAWAKARTYRLSLTATTPQPVGRRRIIATAPEGRGLGIALRPASPSDACRTEPGPPAADPSASEVLLGPGCVTEGDGDREMAVDLTLCASESGELAELDAIHLLLTHARGATARALACEGAP